MTKRVYLFDGENNAFNGFWNCQESPLEPGIYITPTASTEIEPPTFDIKENTCTWDGTQWILTPVPKPIVNNPAATKEDQPTTTGTQTI